MARTNKQQVLYEEQNKIQAAWRSSKDELAGWDVYFNYWGNTISESLAQSLPKYEIFSRDIDIDVVEISDK